MESLPIVAIVGRANVGKSTLFNRLLGERRSLVEDRPGVTRDRVAAPSRMEGVPVLLVDTGGLEPGAEQGIPAAVARQVEEVLETASVVLFTVSARDGLLPADRLIADLLRRGRCPVVLVANKADGPLGDATSGDFFALGFDEVLPVSAEHRRGLRDVEIAVAERLPERERAAGPDLGVRVALIGRPNVGKSSLLNRLVGEPRAIVSEVAGTTRDSTDTRLQLLGRTVTLIDTAGLRRASRRADRLERGTAFQSLRAIERADVAVLLLDASEGVTDQDAKIARLALDRGRGLVLVLNKWDCVPDPRRRDQIRGELLRRLSFVPDPVRLEISAQTGKGVHRVLPAVLALADEMDRQVSTAELNRLVQEAVQRHSPPMSGRRRPRFYYATQTSSRPLTVLVFVNDPALIGRNYRRYLESFLRKHLGVRSAPLRLRLRPRHRRDARERGSELEVDGSGGGLERESRAAPSEVPADPDAGR